MTYLDKCDYTLILKDIAVIKKGKMFICYGSIIDDSYRITHDSYIANNSKIEPNSNPLPLKIKICSTDGANM